MPNFGDLFGGSNIKSIQRGVITVNATDGSANVAIASVNPAFSELRMLGVSGTVGLDTGSGQLITHGGGYVTLTGGGTSITGTTLAGVGGVTKISWELTEYYPS